GSGPWVRLGGYVKQISATVENTIYAIGTDDNIYLSHGLPGLGWFNTGLKARQISAGVDGGNPEVYAIGFDNHVYAGNGSGGGAAASPIGAATPSRSARRWTAPSMPSAPATLSTRTPAATVAAGGSPWAATPSRSAPGSTAPSARSSWP